MRSQKCPLWLGNPPETCRRCAKPLPRRKDGKPRENAVWCSRECSDEFWRQHNWQAARNAAVKRDGGMCVRRDQHEDPEAVKAEMADRVEEARDEPDLWGRDRDEWNRRRRERDALDREYLERIGALNLEVNHIEPRNGRGYAWGCHNHVDGLETMCRPHHVEETTRQRRGWPLWRDDPRPLEEIEAERRSTSRQMEIDLEAAS